MLILIKNFTLKFFVENQYHEMFKNSKREVRRFLRFSTML